MSMRTLAATFSSRTEAEAVSRRIEAIGVSPDRIILKEVPRAEPGSATATMSGVFLSVKVTTGQVQPVSEILKAPPLPGEAAAPAVDGAAQRDIPSQRAQGNSPTLSRYGEPTAAHRVDLQADSGATYPRRGSDFPPRAVPAHEPTVVANAVGSSAQSQQPAAAKSLRHDRARLGRYLVYYSLALVAAFILGAWLGLLS